MGLLSLRNIAVNGDHILHALTVQAKLSSQQFSDTTTNLGEKEAVAKLTATVIYDKGRYSVGIPWKNEEPNLNNNYDMALRRLKSPEKALARKGPEAVQAYNKIIEDYERKGYVKNIEKTNETNQ